MASILFQIPVLGKTQTVKIRTRNNIYCSVFHPCYVTLGPLAEGHGPKDQKTTGWIKIPRAMIQLDQCLGEALRQGCWGIGVQATGTGPGNLPAASCLPSSLQFLCFPSDVPTHTPHSFCSWFWSHSCRSYGFQEVIHLGSFISAPMNSFILK